MPQTKLKYSKLVHTNMAKLQDLINDFKQDYTDATFLQPELTALLLHKIADNVSPPVTTNIVFSGSATSSTFAIANRLAIIVCPAISGAPTLTLQVTLDNGITWVDTSVTLSASAGSPKTLEADSLAKVSGAFGLTNAFRFTSTSSISATLIVRSITQ